MTTRERPQPSVVEDEIYALSVEKFRWKNTGPTSTSWPTCSTTTWCSSTSVATSPPNRSAWASCARRFVYVRIDLQQASVRAYGDTAVLVGKATFVVNGGSIYPLVYTEVYTRKNGRWRQVNLHTCSGNV